MNSRQDDQKSPELDSVDQLANRFTQQVRRGKKLPVEQLEEQFPELSGDVDGLMKTLSVLEEAGFRRRVTPPCGSVVDAAGRRQQMLGGFRLIREISRGGMGIVYEAEQESLNRRVAVKVLPPSPLLTDVERARFEREGTAVARLHHSHIVPVFGTGEQDGVPYCVMQYIEGYSLDDLIRGLRDRLGRFGNASPDSVAAAAASESQPPEPLTPEQTQPAEPDTEHAAGACQSIVPGFPLSLAVDLMFGDGESSIGAENVPSGPASSAIATEDQRPFKANAGIPPCYWQNVARLGADVADALRHAHHRGVLHRDIKPGNLLLDRNGHVWVTDFGLAKLHDKENLTATGNLIGTLRYTSPEQFRGESDCRSDIYGLGLTLYELCALKPAFASDDQAELMRQVITEIPTRPRLLNPSIPRDLETVILKAIAPEPEKRYQTAGDLELDLRNFVDDRPLMARRQSSWERGWRWCRRHRLETTLAGFALGMLVLFSVTASIAYVREAGLRRDSDEMASAARAALDRVYDSYLPDWTTSSTVSAHGAISVSPASAQLLEELVVFYDDLASHNRGSRKEVVLQSTAAMRRVGLIYHRLGKFEKSRSSYARALDRLARFNLKTPDLDVQLEQARVFNELGAVAWTQRGFLIARQYHQNALSLLETVQTDAGEAIDESIRFETARTLFLLARRQLGLDGGVIESPRISENFESTTVSPIARREMIARAVQILEDLTDADPTNLDAQHLLALSHREQSDGYLAADGHPADEFMILAIDRLEDLLSHASNHPAYRYSLCRTLQWLNLKGNSNADAIETAITRFQRSIEIAEQLSEQHPDEWIYMAAQIAGHYQMSRAFRRFDRYSEGIASCDRAIELAEQLSAVYPDGDWFHYLVGSSYRRRGDLLRLSGQPALALVAYDEAANKLTELLQHPPTWQAQIHRTLYRISEYRSELLASFGRTEESQQAQREAEEFKQRWQRSLAGSN